MVLILTTDKVNFVVPRSVLIQHSDHFEERLSNKDGRHKVFQSGYAMKDPFLIGMSAEDLRPLVEFFYSHDYTVSTGGMSWYLAGSFDDMKPTEKDDDWYTRGTRKPTDSASIATNVRHFREIGVRPGYDPLQVPLGSKQERDYTQFVYRHPTVPAATDHLERIGATTFRDWALCRACDPDPKADACTHYLSESGRHRPVHTGTTFAVASYEDLLSFRRVPERQRPWGWGTEEPLPQQGPPTSNLHATPYNRERGG